MVTRACISINNRCNLNCTYCHFHEKKDYIQEDNMDVITILDIITSHIEDNDIDLFKLGFVGNGEPMLDYEKLKQYIVHIGDYLKSGRIAAYTITNGLLVDREKLEFFKEYNVNVGFSVDGISAIHDKYRCGTHERVMDNIFYANGKIFICGNCIDLPFSMPYDTPLNEVGFDVIDFDRNCCFKEVFTG